MTNEQVELFKRVIGWAEIAHSFVDPETTDITIECGKVFNMADDLKAAKAVLAERSQS